LLKNSKIISKPDIHQASPTMGKVAVVKTEPENVIEDYEKLLEISNYNEALVENNRSLLKVNISWQHYYPACSTAPWQLEGVGKKLIKDGYKDLLAAHNGTVVVDPEEGRYNNKHKLIEDKLGLKHVVLDQPPIKWIKYKPKNELLVLDKVYEDELQIPEILLDTNIIHLPTVKTHVFTTMTGALKNAFGGLLHRNRHWTHSVIHETLVDLLQIQKEIHSGIFAVMDGTFAGDGPGPRAMRIHTPGIILASADQVAIDSIAAKLMGLNPMEIPMIRLSHEKGLGVGDPKDIEILGDDISKINWNFKSNENTLASRGQKLIYHGPLKPIEKILLRSFIAPWAFLASNIYHNKFWLPFIGRRRIKSAMKTSWGKLFNSYK